MAGKELKGDSSWGRDIFLNFFFAEVKFPERQLATSSHLRGNSIRNRNDGGSVGWWWLLDASLPSVVTKLYVVYPPQAPFPNVTGECKTYLSVGGWP